VADSIVKAEAGCDTSLHHSSLATLDLSRKNLTIVPADVLQLRSLRVLVLSENALTRLPEEFGQLTELGTLDLGHNRLERLPKSFNQLRLLSGYLYLHDNQLTELEDSVFENFTMLRYLNLSGNPLRCMPTSIGALRNLEELRIEKLGLTSLPEYLGNLGKLEELSLRDNGLRLLPDSFTRLTRLSRLDLRGNRFEEVPEVVRRLNLTKLDLRWNPLISHPAWLQELHGRGTRVLL